MNIPLTWWWVAECGVWRHILSLNCVGDQQLTETHHDWIVVIVVSKDHTNPSAVAWKMQEKLSDQNIRNNVAFTLLNKSVCGAQRI